MGGLASLDGFIAKQNAAFGRDGEGLGAAIFVDESAGICGGQRADRRLTGRGPAGLKSKCRDAMRALKADYGQTIPDYQPLSIAHRLALKELSVLSQHVGQLTRAVGGAILHADADKSAVIDDGKQVTFGIQRQVGQAAKTGIVGCQLPSAGEGRSIWQAAGNFLCRAEVDGMRRD